MAAPRLPDLQTSNRVVEWAMNLVRTLTGVLAGLPSFITHKAKLTNVTNDATVVIPPNHVLLGFFVENKTANVVTGGIKVGTTSGGTDVIAALAVGANAKTHAADSAILLRFFSSTAEQTLYIQDVVAWNNANLDITVVYGSLT